MSNSIVNKKIQTAKAYNKSARASALKFDSIRPRISYIEESFDCVGKKNPKVLEIGYGSGRDAVEILKRTDSYVGIDISKEMRKLAKSKIPEGNFKIADVTTFEFPKNLDVVLAFASLIHVDKEELKNTLDKIYGALNNCGVVYLSLKQGDEYKEMIREDEFGIKTYYLYSEEDIKEIMGNFKIVKNEIEEIKKQKWLEIILQK